MTLDFSDFLEALDDNPFEENPVDLDTFLHDPMYLDQPKLSQIQRDLVEIVELKDHPFFIACQFHPEFQSKPDQAHSLFAAFIKASLR